ncbi:hypothetical protein [Niabella sp.]|uniref:hypothetical protein n=1 Tax=Niabella sp. TaxID=1962976 RepID=UPI0026238B97|nr:hypothetical protein [Niabella sp.]
MNKQKLLHSIYVAMISYRRFVRLSWTRMLVALFILLSLTTGVLVSYSFNITEAAELKPGESSSVYWERRDIKGNKESSKIVKVVSDVK